LAYNDAVRDVIDSHTSVSKPHDTADKSRGGANTIPSLSQCENSLQNSLLSPLVVPSIDPSSPGIKPRKTHLNQICTAPSENINVTEIDSRPFTGEIEEALMSGWKQWRRSKIMIVGESRAGKTGLANSIIGKPFEDTVSTVGINDMILNVKYACRSHEGERVDEGVHWTEYPQPEKELETAVAQEVSRKQRQCDTAVDDATNVAFDESSSRKFVDTNKDDADVVNAIVEVQSPQSRLPVDLDHELVSKHISIYLCTFFV
jgi:ethanolamine utilization protein EutP (predicted NTPase)